MRPNQTGNLIDQALEQLGTALSQGRSAALTSYLAAMARFPAYSWGNLLLIVAQRPEASRVAGFGTWLRLGRYVKKGEKGILIYAPIVRRKFVEEETIRGPPGEKDDEFCSGFKAVYVFDLSQTDGKALPEASCVAGNPNGRTDRLKASIAARGISLEYSSDLGRADGRSHGGKISIREGLSPAEEFSVLVHELAHELLHHDGVAPPKTVREAEAEAVAFVVSQAIGLDALSASADYIQLYHGNSETLAQSLERIQRTAVTILQAVGSDPAWEPPQEARCAN